MNHQHGGQPEVLFERLGLEPRALLDFSVNVSPLGVPESVQRIWPSLIQQSACYPSMSGEGIKAYYMSRFGLSANHVIAGNGSIDLIYDVPRILGIKCANIPLPSFYDYRRSCEVFGTQIVNRGFNELKGCDACFIGNPNNPTGELLSSEAILELADQNPGVTFFVDEAFIQFVEEFEAYTLMRHDRLRDNIVVFHSLTKVYALPGLRLGACISTPDTIRRIVKKRSPWMASRVAERIAEVLAEDREYEKKVFSIVSAERSRIEKRLESMKSFRPKPGKANFLLVQWTGTENLDDLLAGLIEQSVFVRDCRNFSGLEGNWFRIAIRLPEENDQLLSALEKCQMTL